MWDILERTDARVLLNMFPFWNEIYINSFCRALEKRIIIKKIIDNLGDILNSDVNIALILSLFTSEELLIQFADVGINSNRDVEKILYNPRLLKIVKLRLLKIIKEDNLPLSKKEEAKEIITGGCFYELLEYQLYIKEQIMNLINSELYLPRCIIHMPTGTGKTKTMIHTLIKYYQENLNGKGMIVWVAHTNTLLQQAEKTLIQCWSHLGHSELNVYKCYGNYKKVESLSNGFLFISIQKLLNIQKTDLNLYQKIKDYSNLICIDEAHKCLAKQTRHTLDQLMVIGAGVDNRYMFGLTATPGRALIDEDENNSLSSMFDSRIIKIDCKAIEAFRKTNFQMKFYKAEDDGLINYFQERKILARLKREEITYENQISKEVKKLFCTSREDYSTELLEIISKDFNRNIIILNRLIQLNDDGIPTIFFAASVEHGKFISLLLNLNNIEVSEVYGDMNDHKKEQEIMRFKKGNVHILINFNVLTTGFDSTNIKCVFIARPTKSIVLYSQMIGRGLRGKKMGGNEECLLIDIKDNLDLFKDENSAFHYFDEYWR